MYFFLTKVDLTIRSIALKGRLKRCLCCIVSLKQIGYEEGSFVSGGKRLVSYILHLADFLKKKDC